MICIYQPKTRSWSVSGNGPLRPIAVDTETRIDGIRQYGTLYQDQLQQERDYFNSMNQPLERKP